MAARPPWLTPVNALVGALGFNAVLLLGANLVQGMDVLLMLMAVLLGAFAALLFVHPHRWVIANGVFALALYAVLLATMRVEGSTTVTTPEMTATLTGPLGLVTVVVAAIGGIVGPLAFKNSRGTTIADMVPAQT